MNRCGARRSSGVAPEKRGTFAGHAQQFARRGNRFAAVAQGAREVVLLQRDVRQVDQGGGDLRFRAQLARQFQAREQGRPGAPWLVGVHGQTVLGGLGHDQAPRRLHAFGDGNRLRQHFPALVVLLHLRIERGEGVQRAGQRHQVVRHLVREIHRVLQFLQRDWVVALFGIRLAGSNGGLHAQGQVARPGRHFLGFEGQQVRGLLLAHGGQHIGLGQQGLGLQRGAVLGPGVRLQLLGQRHRRFVAPEIAPGERQLGQEFAPGLRRRHTGGRFDLLQLCQCLVRLEADGFLDLRDFPVQRRLRQGRPRPQHRREQARGRQQVQAARNGPGWGKRQGGCPGQGV